MIDPVAPPALQSQNLYAVASGKGGVGKTWFSITFCHALAQLGKRVLLFDGDFGLANVDIQLGLTPEKDLAHFTEGNLKIEEIIVPYAKGAFDIVAGRSGSGNLASLPTDKLVNMRSSLLGIAPRYDYVFVDLGAGVEKATRQMAGAAKATFVVVTDEPTALTDSYAFIKLMLAGNPKADLRIVVNMATSLMEGSKTYETLKKVCETFLGYTPKLGGIIHRDRYVRETIRAQTSLLTRFPSAQASLDITQMAQTFLE
ncbi:MAG: MinD/ParA family protein [Alphaproteobacteria bacterium]|nr:MinD/ParA family protein [Alphaproteobacteria bacterium]